MCVMCIFLRIILVLYITPLLYDPGLSVFLVTYRLFRALSFLSLTLFLLHMELGKMKTLTEEMSRCCSLCLNWCVCITVLQYKTLLKNITATSVHKRDCSLFAVSSSQCHHFYFLLHVAWLISVLHFQNL